MTALGRSREQQYESPGKFNSNKFSSKSNFDQNQFFSKDLAAQFEYDSGKRSDSGSEDGDSEHQDRVNQMIKQNDSQLK